MKAHLMFRDRDFALDARGAAHEQDLLQDLGLGTILDTMADDDQFLRSVATRGLLSSLTSADEITYRQQVFSDCLANRAVVVELYNVAICALKIQKGLYGGLIRNPSSVMHHSIEALGEFLGSLRELRDLAAVHGPRFQSEGFATLFAMLQRELGDDYIAEVQGHLRRLEFRNGLLLSAHLGTGNKGTGYTLRRPVAKPRPWWDLFPRDTEPSLSFRIADRDEAGANAIGELRAKGMNTAANALAQATDHILSFFRLLQTELAFYIAALHLHGALADAGVPQCVPVPVQKREGPVLHGTHVYDAVLALAGRDVVGNDLTADDKTLIMITGANQGGKSTLLRSIGQAQLMMQAGLMVCAGSFSASPCHLVVTHFKREEDRDLVRGKLDEELARMRDIVAVIGRGDVILFNESFASTNEREGSEIARNIIRALTERGVRVIFVTHLYDLALSQYAAHSPTALFLRAERGTEGRRTFRIAEGEPLSTSFGVDLYRRIFGSLPSSPGEPAAAAGGRPDTSNDEKAGHYVDTPPSL